MTKYFGFANIIADFQASTGIHPKYLVMANRSGISKRYPLEKRHRTFLHHKTPNETSRNVILENKICRRGSDPAALIEEIHSSISL
jgi:hypothetical protein